MPLARRPLRETQKSVDEDEAHGGACDGLMNSPNQSRAVVMVGRSICHSNGSAQFEVRPTRARHFDRVANDPRMAFMRVGYIWRLTIRDPRLSIHAGE